MPTLTIPACTGCCKFCHDGLGDNLSVAISGILKCPDCYTINPGGGAADVKFSFTGLNGLFTAAWNAGTSAWEVVIGTATATFYASSDGSCTGSTTTSEADVVLSLQCSGENQFTAIVGAGVSISINVFSNAGTPFHSVLTNAFVLGDCGTGSAPSFIGAYGGTITLSL